MSRVVQIYNIEKNAKGTPFNVCKKHLAWLKRKFVIVELGTSKDACSYKEHNLDKEELFEAELRRYANRIRDAYTLTEAESLLKELFHQHQIKTLNSLLSKLPKERDETFKDDENWSEEYGEIDGWNDCLAEVKTIIEEMKWVLDGRDN